MGQRHALRLFPIMAVLLFWDAKAWALDGGLGAIPVVSEQVVDLPLPTGGNQRVLYVAPSAPRLTLIMLPGGEGDIGLTSAGDVRHGGNFLVRTRTMWAGKGYAVVIPDAIGRGDLRGVRSSPDYAAVVADLVRFARTRHDGPVFLVGTSQGSIAAANGAAHAEAGAVAGVVLTESVSRLGGSHETVFNAGLEDIRVPALVVANQEDRCTVAPPGDAAKIVAAMTHSPDAHAMEINGGSTVSDRDCEALTPHGYYGIETRAVDAIADWIDAHAR